MRFTELFHTLHEGVYVAAADDRVIEMNPALAQMLGFARKEDAIGATVASLFQKAADRVAERAELERAGFLSAREVTLTNRLDGHTVVALHTSAVIRDSASKVVRYQGTMVDITEQRAMEHRLHHEQEFARRLIDSFPGLAFVLDREGRYTFISPQITEVLGYSPHELMGEHLGERMDPQDRDAWDAVFQRLISEQGGDAQIEYREQHKLGAWRKFRASARPLHDENGRVQGIIVSARDITEEEKLQQQLIQSERLAAMGRMIAGVAHELNNPLTAILGVTELMRDQATDAGAQRRLDLAHAQARRAAQIVQSLLVFSRPTAPRSTLLHVSDVLQHTLQLHDHSLRANRIHVDFLPRPELPTIVGDANQLIQVFLNLIVNAEQAIHEVRDHGTLRIRLGAVRERVLITFQDDGAGIRRETLPHIFDPFFTTKDPGRGTGLGLSICMAIIREHHGHISAQTVPGGGSVFTIALPFSSEPVALAKRDTTIAHPTPPAVAPAAVLRGKRVLVVDDEESIRELAEDGLKTCGIHVNCASSAEQARKLARQQSYDAIMWGVRSESADALDENEALFNKPKGTKAPVFIFLAEHLLGNGMQDKLASRSHLLRKPFPLSELVALLTEIFSPDEVLQPKSS